MVRKQTAQKTMIKLVMKALPSNIVDKLKTCAAVLATFKSQSNLKKLRGR